MKTDLNYMEMIMDLSYTQDKMFTTFYANTPAGVNAWNTMASAMNGVAKVLNFEANRVMAELRKAGYSVGKEKKSELSIDEILTQLGV